MKNGLIDHPSSISRISEFSKPCRLGSCIVTNSIENEVAATCPREACAEFVSLTGP